MATLLVRGIDEEGPGDVVGALAGEADIAPERIGEIEVEDGEATVEVDLDAGELEELIETMDGNRVGRSEVSVARLDDRTRAVREYVADQSRLVELEREVEMERHEREIRVLSGREREAKGRALLDTRGREEGESVAGYLVKFVKGEGLPDVEFTTGDLLMVSKRDPLREDNPTGTVTEVTNYSVTLAFDDHPPGWVTGDGIRLDHYVNDVTYQRMLDALDRLPDAEGALERPRDVIVGLEDPAAVAEGPRPAAVETFHDPKLNDAQREAVRRALGTEDVHLIHGPPGTGKTTTAVEAIRQAIDRGESVLATAASNTAVDNVVEFLAGDVDVVRVGHPARVTPTLREHTLDARLKDNETYRESRAVREEAFDLLDEREDLTAPSGRWRRGLSDDRIRELAEEGRSSRGIPAERIEEMAEWLAIDERLDDLFGRSDRLEAEAIAEELSAADVICTTNSTAGSDLLADHGFDTLVVDEATQATEPSCLIPLVKVDRAIMAGDHRQLPPTIQSQEAAREGLAETLFEKLAERYEGSRADDGSDGGSEVRPDPIRSLLLYQYRMHRRIQDFPSERFYDGRLEADEAVREHTLAGLGVEPDGPDPVLDPADPLVFVDTSDAEASEHSPEGSLSKENPQEADLVAGYAHALVEAGIDPAELAVISPYDAQVQRLEDRIDVGCEIDTVDGFQGREKEAVLVSLVRSNPEDEIGFLDEPRRFNVALTRARRKAIVVGDGDTVTAADVFEEFVSYARDRGTVVAASQ